MNRDCRQIAGLLLALTLAPAARADTPSASYIFPAGGQRGTTVHFHVGGHYLHEVCDFEMQGPGIDASRRIRRVENTVWFEGPRIPMPASQAKEDYPKDQAGQVAIAADAPLGLRRWRVATSQGATPTRTFVIGDLPEIVEDEIDGDPVPTDVHVPVTINGRIFPREDVDVWVFQAEQGRGYTCEVMASRIGSPLDSHLELRGPDGLRLAESTDALGSDSRITFVAPETGEYQLRIHDVQFAGLQHYVYRLTITDEPYATSWFPLGGKRGSRLALSLIGQNVPAGNTELTVPSDAENTWHARPTVGDRQLNRIRLEASDFPEIVEGDAPPADAHSAPVVWNGRITAAGQEDRWWLEAAADQKLTLDLRAARLGSPLDSVLTVLDAEGKQLAQSDDLANGQTDSALTFTAPQAGRYQVIVKDRFEQRGGTEFSYRLVATEAVEPEPGFKLTLASDTLTVNRGTESVHKVTIQRSGGFSGEVTLAAEGLPEGIELTGNKIPANKNETNLGFKVPEDARVQRVSLKVIGTATHEEKMLTASAVVPATSIETSDREGMLLAVAIPTPYKIVGIFQTQYSPRGGTFLRTYSIERNGYEGPIMVKLGDRQARHLQGVTGPTMIVPAGATEFTYPIKLAPWMEVGRTSRTVVMGVAMWPDGHGNEHKVSYTSLAQNDQIIILVDPGQLSVELGETAVLYQPGKTLDLPVAVDRGRGLEGDVTVELVAPDHIKDITAQPLELPRGQREGILQLKYNDQLKSSLNMPLTVRVTAMPSGRPYTVEAKLRVLPPSASSR